MQKREYQKVMMRKKRAELYKNQDLLAVVRPSYQLKNKDGTNSPFTFTPIFLTPKDKLTLQKLITGQFI